MTGYHGPDGYVNGPLDDRDARDEHGRVVETVDEEMSKMAAHNDEHDPLNDYHGPTNL